MKKITILVIALIITNLAIGQRDKKATQILDKVIQKTESHQSLGVDFSYKMENPEAGIDETKDGILLVQGNKYRLNIAGQLVISDGTTLWTLLVEDEEVMVNSVEENSEAITPSNLLNSYQDNYKSKFIKEDRVGGKTIEIIELTPLQGKSYTKVIVKIDKIEKQILSFSIFDKNGSTYSYIINKYTSNVAVEENSFNFSENDYPDFEVIDMR